jgi:hypothetical protein
MTDPLRNRQASAALVRKKNFYKTGTNLYQMSPVDSSGKVLEQTVIAMHLQRAGRQKHDSHIIKEERTAFRQALEHGATVEDGPHRIWLEKHFHRGKIIKILQIY